ncbi:hypothetical protein [Psychrobacter sp.]|uniref:hypothetical protein n=1 Tax=Psychrobacter sp. TaxID=56811 RepID=UPI003F995D43
MIDGIWWLVILFAVIAVIWILAKSRGGNTTNGNETLSKKSSHGRSKKQKSPVNDGLQKTSALLGKHFPEYHVNRKAKHIMLSQHDKKIAMITMDKKLPVGQRRLGDITVINYHRVPGRAQLTVNLEDAG